ncbi:MAG: Mut7-C RNAse domain-containing protein [Thermodesulfobacteriota bacterium]
MLYRIAPHLAFLIQWLRVLGINVLFWEKGLILDPAQETVVQWDRYPLPLKEKNLPIISLSETEPQDLLQEFLLLAGIRPTTSDLFTRCLRCNGLLVSLTPAEAKEKWPELPVYVFKTQKRFNWCATCRHLFWAGTHVRNMVRTLKEWGIPLEPQ